MRRFKIVIMAVVIGLTEFTSLTNAQTWNRQRDNDLRNVVAIVKPRRGGRCENHRIRADGLVYDGLKGTRGSYLVVDQVVTLTGKTDISDRGYRIWQVIYEPSQTVMWLNDCDLSIPRISN